MPARCFVSSPAATSTTKFLLTSAWTPHLLVAERYGARPGVSRRRRRTPIHPDRRLRHEHRHRRCLRPWLEACRRAARLCGAEAARRLTTSSADRSACATARRRSATAVRAAILPSVYHDRTAAPAPTATMARAEAGHRIAAFGNAENESFGIEYGYAYRDSPVICAEPDADIPDDPLRYVPTTAPGARMPSVVLADGTPIFDRLGLWFTLVCVGMPPSIALVAAAARRGAAARRVAAR